MAFYPLMGPVITILFVKDYRRFILCALRYLLLMTPIMDLGYAICYLLVAPGGADPFKLAILIESLVMLLALAQLSPFCAMRIHQCLKSNSLSSRTKAIQKKMLLLLSIEHRHFRLSPREIFKAAVLKTAGF
ncbi:hypothetical protein TELCIR_12093 [Teladorsagia circumcincta]|uniref:Uncharacterized protein n=1 Tax=Teladorsagia circumcincta TaxID=45464 RepID=A0A2G9U7L0_TELCI|nr:hypothetical protein TELCIR_12093 [Teladorsagia circumcincta]